MDIFNYLPVIVGIKNSDFTPILTKATINSSTKQDIHKRLLSDLAVKNYPVAMVFENELFLLRSLGNINNNEIRDFIRTDNSWDIVILSPFTGSSSVVNGYNIIRKVNDTSTFFNSQIYIASSRFMQKIKNNNYNSIETYVYIDSFIDNISTTPVHKSTLYTLGVISNISIISLKEIKYSWNEYLI
jgi:hypothetical protein